MPIPRLSIRALSVAGLLSVAVWRFEALGSDGSVLHLRSVLDFGTADPLMVGTEFEFRVSLAIADAGCRISSFIEARLAVAMEGHAPGRYVVHDEQSPVVDLEAAIIFRRTMRPGMSDSEGTSIEFERVSAGRQQHMRDLAEAACKEFLSAGLPAVVMPGTEPLVGVNIDIDSGADQAGGVYASWSPSEALDLAAAFAVNEGRFNDPVIKHSAVICQAMIDAMLSILISVGFAAKVSENELIPLSVEILSERRE